MQGYGNGPSNGAWVIGSAAKVQFTFGIQGYGTGPSNGAWVIGNAAVVESNNVPNINTLTNRFFMRFLLGV